MKNRIAANILIGLVFYAFFITTIYAAVNRDILLLLHCVLNLFLAVLPLLIERALNIVLPSGMLIAFAIFLFCANYLGELCNFYFLIPHWDTALHTFSGFALSALGLSIINLLNKSESVPVSLSPAFVALFAFCFAVACGTVWEIFEFAVDALADFNMQKYMLESGEILVGRAALADTMKDIIVDTLGALTTSILGYVSMKQKDGWIARMQIQKSLPARAPVYTLQSNRPPAPPAVPAEQADAPPERLPIAL